MDVRSASLSIPRVRGTRSEASAAWAAGASGCSSSSISGRLAGSGAVRSSRSVQSIVGCCAATCAHGPRQISVKTPRSVFPELEIALELARCASWLRTGVSGAAGGSVMSTNVYIDGVCRWERVYADVEKLRKDSSGPPSLRTILRSEYTRPYMSLASSSNGRSVSDGRAPGSPAYTLRLTPGRAVPWALSSCAAGAAAVPAARWSVALIDEVNDCVADACRCDQSWWYMAWQWRSNIHSE